MTTQRTIITPRGTFKVEEYEKFSNDKVVEINKQGYNYWFSKITTTKEYIINEMIYIKQGKMPIKYKVLTSVEVIA